MDRGQFRRRPRVCRGQRPVLTQPYLGLPDVLEVWNDQESAWIPCPVGHSVVKGRLGEFYPISPAAIAETYEPADGDQVTVSREDLRVVLATTTTGCSPGPHRSRMGGSPLLRVIPSDPRRVRRLRRQDLLEVATQDRRTDDREEVPSPSA